MLPRTLEPEVMDTAADAADYDVMDHSHVNRVFVDDLLAAWGRDSQLMTAFDAGTGTALIPIELCRHGWAGRVIAADAAGEMLKLARRNIDKAGLSDRIEPVLRDCKQLPEPDDTFDLVMSNSIVHHIPEPFAVFEECWRVLKRGGLLFLRDLLRPNDREAVEHLVRTYADDANAHQQQLFRESLHAALTVDEVRELVEPLGIAPTAVQATSDRHWTLSAWKAV